MLTPLKSEIGRVSDLNHEVRRFRTILWSFERNIDLLFRNSGYNAVVDHAALAEAFSRWRLGFDHAKYLADVNRYDFVIFAAGLMLKELIAAAPLKALTMQESDSDGSSLPAVVDHRLTSWPEGYAYTSFCLSVAGAILQEGGDEISNAATVADDPQFWASFRENSEENPALAIAFFDLVCGEEPNWQAPDVPWMRKLMEKHQAQLTGSELSKLKEN